MATSEADSAAPAITTRIDGDKLWVAEAMVSSEQLDAALGQRPEGVTRLVVALSPTYDDDMLGRLITAAARAELRRVELRHKGRAIGIALTLAVQTGPLPGLVVWNHKEQLLVYDVGATSPPAGTFEPVTIGNEASERALSARLAKVCGDDDCHASLELMSGDRAQTWRLLDAWQRVTASLPRMTAKLSMSVSVSVGGAPGEASSRLPPTLIQAIVRKDFPAFRMCYELGLARDAMLGGRINVQFTIAVDGKVSSVRSSPDSTMPDKQVVSCVLTAFGRMAFPAPGMGKVDVTYPIMLAPG